MPATRVPCPCSSAASFPGKKLCASPTAGARRGWPVVKPLSNITKPGAFSGGEGISGKSFISERSRLKSRPYFGGRSTVRISRCCSIALACLWLQRTRKRLRPGCLILSISPILYSFSQVSNASHSRVRSSWWSSIGHNSISITNDAWSGKPSWLNAQPVRSSGLHRSTLWRA